MRRKQETSNRQERKVERDEEEKNKRRRKANKHDVDKRGSESHGMQGKKGKRRSHNAPLVHQYFTCMHHDPRARSKITSPLCIL